jgi:hypothetical protein
MEASNPISAIERILPTTIGGDLVLCIMLNIKEHG